MAIDTEKLGAAAPGSQVSIWGTDAQSRLPVPIVTDANGKLQVIASVSVTSGATTIADGADVAEGATSDAAVSGDAAGTTSAKLRQLNKIFTDVWDPVNHLFKTTAGSTTVDFGTAITGQSLEAGGASNLGWLSSIRKAITDRLGTLGQKAMAASTPVVIASDQSAVNVNAGAITSAETISVVNTAGGSLATNDNGGSLTIDSPDLGTTTDAESASGNGSLIAIAKRLRTLLSGGLPAALSSAGGVKVGVVDALPTGANAIGKLAANDAVDIGDVTINNTVLPAGGDVANDGVDSGNPVKFGGVAQLITGPGAVSTAGDRVNSFFDGQGRQMVRMAHQALPSDAFNVVHRPAVNTQATIGQAAPGSTKRLVVTAITVTLVAGSTAPAAIQVAVTLVADTAGAATELWSMNLALPATAGASTGLTLSNLWIEAPQNKDFRLRFEAAGGANTFESVALSGVIVTE